MRAPGMTVWRMPLLVWANATTSALVVFGTPFIAGSQFMTLFDRVMGTNFFDPASGGDVIAYQHVFWFYSHPAVYIMMLPGFGIVSEVIATFSRKPIFGYRALAFSTVAIAVLGLRRLGAPHVRQRHGALAARADDDHHDHHRHPDRREGVLLARARSGRAGST